MFDRQKVFAEVDCLLYAFKSSKSSSWGLYMCFSLNSLKGGYIGDYIWDYYRGY